MAPVFGNESFLSQDEAVMNWDRCDFDFLRGESPLNRSR
jgi:hypothetical protein